MDIISGHLEVGRKDAEIIINHPQLQADAQGVGHIVFSANQARRLAETMLRLAAEIEPNPGEYFIDFNTTQEPGKIQAVRVRLALTTIENMEQVLSVALADHPLYVELERYVLANRR